eukprot:20326-Heterococcus_DN1.PRE.3
MAVAYLAIGLLFDSLPKRPFLAIFLYSITFIFSNFGPNTSTFMLPSLTFRRQARSTLSGVSAAADDATSDSNGSDESCDLQDSFDNDVDNKTLTVKTAQHGSKQQYSVDISTA